MPPSTPLLLLRQFVLSVRRRRRRRFRATRLAASKQSSPTSSLDGRRRLFTLSDNDDDEQCASRRPPTPSRPTFTIAARQKAATHVVATVLLVVGVVFCGRCCRDRVCARVFSCVDANNRRLQTRIMSSSLNSHRKLGFGTLATHAGQEPERWEMNQVVPSISMATTYKQPLPGVPKGYDYARAGNPTRAVLEDCLAALEDAQFCKVYSSGLAATSAIVNLLKSGDRIICNDDGYGGTQRMFRRISAPNHGLIIDMVDLSNPDKLRAALTSDTKLVWFETPSNPLMKLVDCAQTAAIVHEFNADIVVVVDNTFMTPYFQQPLNLGADIVLHSLTKYINGHSDVCMGAAITNREDLNEHLYFQQLSIGAVPSPFDCYLCNRGAKTLHVRMRQHMENALAVAQWLEANPRCLEVLYPELESHPQHQLHKKQTRGMSGMVSFYLRGDLDESRTFLSALKIFTLAESLGGFESLAELPSVMTHASVPADERAKLGLTDNLIRLSVGIEDAKDLIDDLDQALKKAVKLPADEQEVAVKNPIGAQNSNIVVSA